MDQISRQRRESSEVNHNNIEWVNAYVHVSAWSHQRISRQSVEKLLSKFAPYEMSAAAMLIFQRMLRITAHEWQR